MINVITPPQKTRLENGIRPVNIQTDLAPLADLIELSFRATMDESGRAAIREMRYLSKIGSRLNMLLGLNDLVKGIRNGYVAIVDGQLVGNVSIYPANWRKEVGKAWLVANVSTHPNYRQRGIAYDLMLKSMDVIQQKGATHAILQVDYDNHHAIGLYEKLGFVRERAFTKWTRSALVTTPKANDELENIFFTKPRRSDWQQEYALVHATRPSEKGGIAWLHPLHIDDFRPSFWRSLMSHISFGDQEKLIVRDENSSDLLAALWIKRSIAYSRSRLLLFTHADSDLRNAEVLLVNVLRRYRSSGFMIEHPHDDRAVNDLLTDYGFRPQRTVWHMRYDY